MQEIAAETVSSWKTVRRHLLYMKIPLRTKDRLINEQVKFGSQRIEGQLLKHESEQAALEKIRMLRGQGFSIRKIVEELNRLRIPCRKEGAQWHIKTVYKILSRINL